jgi:hypothetical protein
MAFGFPPSYTERIDLVGSRRTAREAVIETFEALEWEFVEIDPYLFRAKLDDGGLLTVSLEEPGVAVIKSRNDGWFPPAFHDLGANKLNVRTFADRFAIKEVRDAKIAEAVNKEHFLNQQGQTPLDRLFKDPPAD